MRPAPTFTAPARTRYCGNGSRENTCRKPAAAGYNPLGLCDSCLAVYPARPASSGVTLHFDPHGVQLAELATTPQARQRERQAGAARVIALPAHEPCGNDGCGAVDSVGVATCVERRSFERCGCERHRDTPTRGNRGCTRCLGVGAVLVSAEVGCGATFALCEKCGLRMRMNSGECAACTAGMVA